ncbi:unnamed protein product [Caenorhabditis angaria]|uniref:Histone-lysine N-methyltransferase n=1 Tax=Caenorhabditis angaria TaxID=860376 RepID=A0A9P1IZC7_9PELO|nr:unnamed protein product [Caenorhabditis angaria]
MMLAVKEADENFHSEIAVTDNEKHSTKKVRRPLKDAASNSSPEPSGAYVDAIAMLREMDITDDDKNWPSKISSHVSRHNLTLKREGKTGGDVYYNDNVNECIFCQTSDDRPLISCRGSMNGFTKHNLRYISQPECQNEILCPLHFCDTCFFERRKQTAFSGKLIECAYCLRAFHYEKCSPIGSKDLELTLHMNENHKFEMVICSAHRPVKEVKQNSHLKICCECENVKEVKDLKKCRICIRSFHQECRAAKEIDGNPIDQDLCESCLTGECIRIEANVIARWNDNKFYPGITREWGRCPMKLRKSNNYDELGYCLIEWQGESSQFSIVSIADCVPMFESSLKLLGKKAKPAARIAWRKMILDSGSGPNLELEPLYREVRRKIDTSKYFDKDGEKLFAIAEDEKYVCDCKTSNETHCEIGKCSNRREYYECPPDCSKDGRRCLNRGISQKEIHPKYSKTNDQGEFIAEYAGEILSKKEVDRRNNFLHYARDTEANLYMMQLVNGRAVDAARAGNIARYINHSCDPNCQTVKRTIFLKERRSDVIYDNRIAVVAIKNIEAGQEITFKYQMDDWLNSEAPDCKCGAENCEGTLGKGRIVEESQEDDEDERIDLENLRLEEEKRKRKAVKGTEVAAKRPCPAKTKTPEFVSVPEALEEYLKKFEKNSAERKHLEMLQKKANNLEFQKQLLNSAFDMELEKLDKNKRSKVVLVEKNQGIVDEAEEKSKKNEKEMKKERNEENNEKGKKEMEPEGTKKNPIFPFMNEFEQSRTSNRHERTSKKIARLCLKKLSILPKKFARKRKNEMR